MITKKDWKDMLKENEEALEKMLDSHEKALPLFLSAIETIKKKLEEAEDDPMPDEIKKAIKEVTK